MISVWKLFYKNNSKSYQETATVVAVCKKFFKFRPLQNLPRVGRPKKVKTLRHEKSLLRVLRCSRFERYKTLCWRAKKSNF